MSGKYLLDTNIVIGLFKEDQAILTFLKKGYEIYLNVIVLGELYYGAYKSNKVAENLQAINEFSETNVILDCDENTSRNYGNIKKNLGDKGTPIPDNDLWIAAIAKQHGLVVITRDDHFSQVDEISILSL